MTAEIAILNKSAVALAADSKVTMTIGGRQKTYDTVDKVFSLSKTEPVGAMIYGNAEFMRFPWETILKEYRRQRPRKSFPTIFDWADDILAYLAGFFPFDEKDDVEAAKRITENATEELIATLINLAEAGQDFAEIEQMVVAEFENQIDELSAQDDYFTEGQWADLEPRLRTIFDTAHERGAAASFPTAAEAIKTFSALLIRKRAISGSSSGLVIAGFGEDELLPSLVSYEIDGLFNGTLKLKERNRVDSTRDSEGAIVPFAQVDMVYRFMEGIDPSLASDIFGSLSHLLVQNSADTARALGKTAEQVERLMPAFESATAAALKEFWSSMTGLRRTNFVDPIVDMAMRLPKDELAHMAESLVSLTSLQRRVSREVETVGGAIDVAVISKGDGLVWIRRKHYFNPDRNLRFVNGYFSEYGSGRKGGGDDD
ncbi:MAG: hypothetical protein EOP24_34345 [Hyphomicrobiales bacterium]|nr:MAG: hypothetical protein EOP24_34345 [Hyphomicrobiales bacterium]